MSHSRKKKYTSFDVRGLAPHVKLVTSGCWEWIGGRDAQGYGVAGHHGRAHRLSYEANIGPVGDMQVLHRCDNPCCVNPLHLFLGNHTDNMRDKKLKGRSGGKLLGMDDVLRAYRMAGANVCQLSDLFGVSRAAIQWRLKNGAMLESYTEDRHE